MKSSFLAFTLLLSTAAFSHETRTLFQHTPGGKKKRPWSKPPPILLPWNLIGALGTPAALDTCIARFYAPSA